MQRVAVVMFAGLLLAGCAKSTASDGAKTTPVAGGAAGKSAGKTGDSAAPVAPLLDRPQDKASAAQIGKPAPDFELADLDDNKHRLSDYAGKVVVLEWFNPECPFVQHAHTEGPLKGMAKQETEQGVVWLAVNSGAPGMQGFEPAKNKEMVATFGMDHPVLRDVDGVVGHLYGAEKTPHMYLIDDKGTLIYAGGVDNAPFGEVADESPRVGYLAEALAALRGGTAVATPSAPPWGCTVKYAKKG